LVLAYLTTEAVRRKSPDIELGSHFSLFCAALGTPPTTGPRGSAASSHASSVVTRTDRGREGTATS